jgi:hypothetical protein
VSGVLVSRIALWWDDARELQGGPPAWPRADAPSGIRHEQVVE